MRERITIGFDVGETEILERVGESDVFIARLSVEEALWMHDELEQKLLDSDYVNDDVKDKIRG